MALGSMNTCQVLLLIIFLFLVMTSNVEPSKQQCVTSYCGDIRNISYPFRLKSDPKGCGNSHYELACEDNRTVYNSSNYRFYVESINYATRQVRFVDDGLQKDNCSSLPRNSVLGYGSNSTYENQSTLVIVNCSKPVSSPFYISTGSCIEGSYFSNTSSNWNLYALVNPKVSDVTDFCNISRWTWTDYFGVGEHINSSSYSYELIHSIMADGFVLRYGVPSSLKITWFCYFDLYGYFHLYNYFYSRRLYYSSSGGQVCRSNYYFGGVLDDIVFWTTWDITIPIVLFCVAKFVIGMPFVAIFLIYKYKRRHLAMDKNIEEFLQAHNNFLPIRYSYLDIKKITRNFKHKLGEGGYGSVYKGILRSGNEVAVKILNKPKSNGQDFISEVATIGRIHHVNVVQLAGFCFDYSKQALVYDFMPNGSLDKHIFYKDGDDDDYLDYKKIYEISLGIARGIEYLHRGCDMQILHFDIKPHNILLDQSFTPKVSDFGLARLYPTDHSIVSLTAARGTLGYMAPELIYKDIGGVSYKADVYSFGMLLMEMAGRRRNLHAHAERSSQIYFPLWVYDQLDKEIGEEMVDVIEEERETVRKMIIVALWCIQLSPNDRPSMNKVLDMLEGDMDKLQLPPKPLLYSIWTPADDVDAEIELETVSSSFVRCSDNFRQLPV